MIILSALKLDKRFRNKALGTIIILLICRILYCIPTPGVSTEYFETYVQANTTLGLMNALSGGALSQMTVAAFGITPLISATIITQILSIFIPSIGKTAKKKTRNDEKRMNSLNMSIAVIIAAAESLFFAIGFGERGLLKEYSAFYIGLTAVIWTAATIFISLMAKIITDNFIGNGISLILFVNIVCGFPSDAETVKNAFLDGNYGINLTVRIIIITAIIFAVFYAAYIIQVTERRIPVTYSGKISADISGKRLNYLPLKMCPGSVMPIVFTGAVFSAPTFI